MTDEEIDNLKPGPELDALVAEKVMGLDRVTASRPRMFSADISAAWRVVEKVPQWEMSVHGGLCYAQLFMDDCPDAIGNTMPEAICKAAMKWVERSQP